MQTAVVSHSIFVNIKGYYQNEPNLIQSNPKSKVTIPAGPSAVEFDLPQELGRNYDFSRKQLMLCSPEITIHIEIPQKSTTPQNQPIVNHQMNDYFNLKHFFLKR